MRDGTRTTTSAARNRLRSALIVAEVTMATALTLGSALLFRSFIAVMQVDPGFTADGLLTFQMNTPAHLTDNAARLAYYDDLEPRLRALPGVVNVGGTTRLPLGSTNVTTYVAVEGRSNLPAEMPEVEIRRSVFDYVSTMGIAVKRGRAFTRDDAPGQPPTVLINEETARRVWPGCSGLDTGRDVFGIGRYRWRSYRPRGRLSTTRLGATPQRRGSQRQCT